MAVALIAAGTATAAPSHRHACHTTHTCPSDHATYKWQGWRCVAKTASERTPAFKKRVVYAKLVYFCKR